MDQWSKIDKSYWLDSFDLITNVSMCDTYIKNKINQKNQQQQQLAALATIQKLDG